MLNKPELELVSPGKLVVATEGNFAPFSMYTPQGELDGIEIRLMKEIARRMELEYCPVVVDWVDLFEGINDDSYDLSSASMDITEERSHKINFADAWVESGAQMLVHADSSLINCTDIGDHTIGTIVDSIWVDLARQLNVRRIVTYPNNPMAVEALIQGAVDVVITDAIVASYVINTMQWPLRKLSGLLAVTQKGWAIKKGKTNLLQAVNRVLAEVVEDQTYAKLTSEMLGYCPYPRHPLRRLNLT